MTIDLPLEAEAKLQALASRHKAASAEFDRKQTPDTKTVAVVLYLSAACIVLGMIGQFGSAADFFMGMAALPAVISGFMLVQRWLAKRRAMAVIVETYQDAAELGFSINSDGTYQPLRK